MSTDLLKAAQASPPAPCWTATGAGTDVVVLGRAQRGRHALTRSLSGHGEIEVIVVGPEEEAAAATA